jgi:hypothetical protein
VRRQRAADFSSCNSRCRLARRAKTNGDKGKGKLMVAGGSSRPYFARCPARLQPSKESWWSMLICRLMSTKPHRIIEGQRGKSPGLPVMSAADQGWQSGRIALLACASVWQGRLTQSRDTCKSRLNNSLRNPSRWISAAAVAV